MTALSVNINKLATIRNARGGNNPDIVQWARDIQSYGVQGITVHPRPDERHIRRSDVYALKEVVHTEFNIEGYPSEDFLKMVEEVMPQQVTFVPDPPDVLTSNAGWDAVTHQAFLKEIIGRMKNSGIRTSIFMDPEVEQVTAAADTGTDRIELYTESYAVAMATGDRTAVISFKESAEAARDLGIGVNAGHDLDLNNLSYLIEEIPFIDEVSIGHALICDALRLGMENTVKLYLRALK